MKATLHGNLFSAIPEALSEELFDPLLEAGGLRLERIVSRGQATPDGEWYDQAQSEWVVLVQGSAGLRVFGEATRTLHAGDYVLLPAHRRHRVEWTSTEPAAVWLALHFS